MPNSVRSLPGIVLVSVALLIGLVGTSSPHAAADETMPIEKYSDSMTLHEFPGATSSHEDTFRYPGRIWADKTVLSQGTTLCEPGEACKPNEISLGDDELGVAISARGSTRHISSEYQAPVDLVIVLDNSRSMVQCVNPVTASDGYCDDPGNYTSSRVYAMTEAVNTAIGVITADNPDNRIAIVQFGTGAGTLFALGTAQFIPGTDKYVSLSAPTANNGTMTFRTATNSVTAGTVNSQIQSTNIQLGVAVGMGILADQPTSAVSGYSQRMPNVLFFTDGEPTLSSTAGNAGTTGNWWNVPINSGTQGPSTPGGTQYYGNGFKAAMVAAYLKNKITDVYNDKFFNATTGSKPVSTRVYTVGLGMEALTSDGRNLALATLDPATQVGMTSNSMNKGFTEAWAAYSASATATVSVPVAASNVSYQMIHPTNSAADYDPYRSSDGIKYNNSFHAPTTTSELIYVFRSIAQQIVDAAPNYPVETENGRPSTSGYVTFTDPLGPFMHVADMSQLSFCPIVIGSTNPPDCDPTFFTNPKVSELGKGVTKYTFSGTYPVNKSSGEANVADLIVTVRKYESLARGDEVTVQIPASLLPLRDSKVNIDIAGNPLSMVQYGAHPLHLFYKVAPKPGVLAALASPMSLNVGGSQDGTALAEYIAANLVDGRVRFYSNAYSTQDNQVIGGTTASWQPSQGNQYYFFSEDTQLFSDPVNRTYLTKAKWNSLNPDDLIWYFVREYAYTDDTNTAVEIVDNPLPTTKAQLLAAASMVTSTSTVVEKDGYMIAQAKLYDLARPQRMDHKKCLDLIWKAGNPVCDNADGNLSGTAVMAKTTSFDSQTVVTTLGNNGYISVPIPGSVTIRKVVHSANGLNPDPSVQFTIDGELLDRNGNQLPGPFDYVVVNLNDMSTPVATGQTHPGEAVILNGNQQVTVMGFPEGSTYNTWEVDSLMPHGYTLTRSSGTSGTISISNPSNVLAIYENTYSPDPVTVASPKAVKDFVGRNWFNADHFTAVMCPEGQPLSSCETANFTPQDSTRGTAIFQDRVFFAPGRYVFSIYEETDTQLPGVSYSGAVYKWTVTVSDNGHGYLIAEDSLTQVATNDGGVLQPGTSVSQVLFTNTFSSDEISFNLIARKMIEDTSSGTLKAPAGTYTFGFSYLGANLEDPSKPDVKDLVFPGADTSNTVFVTNAITQVAAPTLTLTSEQVGNTFYYKSWEEAGNAPSTTYTDTVWYWKVFAQSVSGDSGDVTILDMQHCSTTASQPEVCAADADNFAPIAEPDRLFLNRYSPASAMVNLQGDKKVEGRPWLTEESFSFTLAANDATTEAAIAAGEILMKEQSTSVKPAQDTREAQGFTFDTIEFTKQGSYQFKVTEDQPLVQASSGTIYDTRTIIYQIDVNDTAHDGVLHAEVNVVGNSSDDPVAHFMNIYRAVRLFGGIDVRKTLLGRTQLSGEFLFTIESLDQASCDKALFNHLTLIGECKKTITSSESGNSHFDGEFNFTQDDIDQVFSYTIIENDTSRPGVTYDLTRYHLTLEPKLDRMTMAIYVVTTIRDAGSGSVYVHDSRTGGYPVLDFTNFYLPDPVIAEPVFSKTLNGRDWLDTDEFTFEWTALTEHSPQPEQAMVTLRSQAEAARFSFGAMTFSVAGVHKYSVRESIPETPIDGVLYDIIPSVITIEVSDDGEGKLVASIVYDGNQDFVNYYQDDPQAWLTLIAIVDLGNTDRSETPKDVRLGAIIQSEELDFDPVTGNGTGIADDGGVERVDVPIGIHGLTHSELDGFTHEDWACGGDHLEGWKTSIPVVGSAVEIPENTHVTCSITYVTNQGAVGPNPPPDPVPTPPWIPSGGSVSYYSLLLITASMICAAMILINVYQKPRKARRAHHGLI